MYLSLLWCIVDIVHSSPVQVNSSRLAGTFGNKGRQERRRTGWYFYGDFHFHLSITVCLPCLTWSLEPLHPVSAFHDGSRWMGCLLVALLQELLCTIIAECRAFDCFFLSMDRGSINVCLFVAT